MSFLKVSKLLVILNIISCGYSSNSININNRININISISNYDNSSISNSSISNIGEQNQNFDRESQLYKKLFSNKYTSISKQRPIQKILNHDETYKMFINEVLSLFNGFKNINLDLNNNITLHKVCKVTPNNKIIERTYKDISNGLKNIFEYEIRISIDYIKKFANIFDNFPYTKNNYINEINEYIGLQNSKKSLSMQEVFNYIAQCSNELSFNVMKSINELIKNNDSFLKVEKLLNDINDNNKDLKKNNGILRKIRTILNKIKEDKTLYSSEQLYNIENKLNLFKNNNPSNISTKLLYDRITKQIIYLQESTRYRLPLYEETFNIVSETMEILYDVCTKLFELFSAIDKNKEKMLGEEKQQRQWSTYIFPKAKILIKDKNEHLDKKFYNVFQYSNKQIFINEFDEFSELHEEITEIFENISNTDKARINNRIIFNKECNTSSIRDLINLGTKNQTSNVYGTDKYGNNYLDVLNTFIGFMEENQASSNWTAKDFISEKVVPLLNTLKNLISNNIDYMFKKQHMIKFDKTIGLYLDFAKNLTIIVDKIANCNVCNDIRAIINEYITNRSE